VSSSLTLPQKYKIMNKVKTIILLIIVSSLTSCYTIKEMNMTSAQKATQCNWVNNR